MSMTLPAAPTAERALLGAILIQGSQLGAVRDVLSPDDFGSEAHRLVYQAMLRVAANGKPIDLVVVEQELTNQKTLEKAGGAGYLAGLLDAVADLDNSVAYATEVREAAVRRRHELPTDVPVVPGLEEKERRLKGQVEKVRAERTALVPSHVLPKPVNDPAGILRRSKAGGARYPIGIAPLDTALAPKFDKTRVGLPLGRIVGVNGAPWEGKSVLASQLALKLALAGLRVVMLVVDEPREDTAERIGQGLGFRHAELNAEYPGTLDELEGRMDGIDLQIIPDEEEFETPPPIEKAAEILLSAPNALGHVLVLDSLHSVYSASEAEGDPERKRIEKRIHALRVLRKRGVLVIFTAEVSRASYASRDPDQRVRSLASGAEGRSIEYGADLLLFLSAGDDDTVKVEVAKNRIGRQKASFAVRLNAGAAQFGPVSEEALESAVASKREESLLATETAIIKFLTGVAPERISGAHIEAEKLALRQDVRAALRSACTKGTIVRFKSGRGGGFVYGLPGKDDDDE